jgi:hypothetical protein
MNIPDTLRSLTSALALRNRERKRLRGPAHLQYAIADSITMLSPEVWQGLTADAGFFMSYAYFAAMEQVLPLNLSPRYALIFDGQGMDAEPVAAMYMQLADISLAQARPEKTDAEDSMWSNPLDQLAQSARQRVLVCGNLLTFGQHGIAFGKAVDPALAWHGVAEVLYRVRQAEKLAGKTHFVMIKDLHAPFIEPAKQLENLSYRYVETEPNMVLTLDEKWQSYDDYLASLQSKYRSSIRNAVLKPMEEAGCSLESVTDLVAEQDRMFALYKMVQVNADFRPFELLPEYFAALQQIAGKHFRCSAVRRAGEMLGFLITVADGETAIAFHIGFDRAAATAGELPLYLRLLHAAIADAIALGCKRISFGRTALEPKASLGAKPEPFGVLIRHRQPVLNKLMKRLLLGIEHDDAPERNPFKKAAAPKT